jgi:hypothetical protein
MPYFSKTYLNIIFPSTTLFQVPSFLQISNQNSVCLNYAHYYQTYINECITFTSSYLRQASHNYTCGVSEAEDTCSLSFTIYYKILLPLIFRVTVAGARWHDVYTANFFQQSEQYVTCSALITFWLFRKQDTNKRSQPPARVIITSHMFPMCHIADKYHSISCSATVSTTTNISFVTYVQLT